MTAMSGLNTFDNAEGLPDCGSDSAGGGADGASTGGGGTATGAAAGGVAGRADVADGAVSAGLEVARQVVVRERQYGERGDIRRDDELQNDAQPTPGGAHV